MFKKCYLLGINLSQRAKNRVKGALFEAQVRYLLGKSGYRSIEPDGRSMKEDKIRGRGGWHQIDAFGYYSYGVPCVYPIRIICEAKNYEGKVGLPVIRNFVGAFKDIAENYFVERLGNVANYLLTKRYTDAGVVFSARGFTLQAQDYAYAQGVFLVSYEDNPLLTPLLGVMENLINSINVDIAARQILVFKNWIYGKMERHRETVQGDDLFATERFQPIFAEYAELLHSIRTSYLGTASGVYPVHLLSRSEIPWFLFEETDETTCRIYYHEETENCLEIVPNNAKEFKLYLSIPKEIIANYRDRIRMLDFKKKFFDYIDVPTQRNEIKRVLTFRLDTEWIDRLRRRPFVFR
jgi:hypothetical protein